MPQHGAEPDTPESNHDVGAVIDVRDLHKTYTTGSQKVHALRGVTLSIDQPGFHAIMGPSGSGKTTLLHMLAALDRPDSGTIRIAGQNIESISETDLTLFRRRHIGIVFQQFNLISTLSALDNVTLPAMLDAVPAAERNERGLELLNALGLADRAHHRPDAMSGGEQQRVAIARALYFAPRVLFADEPTGNLDSSTSGQMWELLSAIAAERDLTVVMVTHEPAAAVHCQRVCLLRDGLIESTFETEGLDAAELATRAQYTHG